MISLKESILSSAGAGKKGAIYRSLASLLKGFKKQYEFSCKGTERVCIPHEGLAYIDDVFRFGFIKTKKKEHDKAIKDWLKSMSYKSAIKEDTEYDVDLLGMQDFKYYQPVAEHLNAWYEMYIFKVDNTAVFIEIAKNGVSMHENFCEMYVFALDINRRANYVEDWKSDPTFVNLINSELK